MSLDLLKHIVETSKANANERYPDGYTYLEDKHTPIASQLHNSGHIEANFNSRDAQGNFPVRPTPLGVQALTHATQTTAQPQPLKTAPTSLKVETGIPVPEKKAFGRTSTGDDKVTQFGFDNWEVNQSVFLPQPEGQENPIHRTFSSVVSQANKKLHPKNFIIREWPGGARIWRVEDMKGPRPTRARTVKAPVAQAQAQPQPGFAPQGGFAAPQGFAQAPQPFNTPGPFGAEPQGFVPPTGPGPDWQSGAGFGEGLPDFGNE